ncbi:MAG: MBOAT family protein [Muribaculaceae bacterium]|nr:MBOAT family protein [Muribaculaceae bacterium]
MVFSDLFFIFVFIPAFILLYMMATWVDKKILPKKSPSIFYEEDELTRVAAKIPGFRARNAALVIFSLIFYAWGEPIYVLLMLIAVVINYIAGLGIAAGQRRESRSAKVWLWIGVILDISMLGTFKYLGFFNDSLAYLGINLNAPRLALPIGISFYIFQSISYLVDVYRKDAPVQRRYWDLLLYISMFPQLIAGPIVRYDKVAREIHQRHVTAEDFADGAYRFFIGLGKKVILANILSEIVERCLQQGVEEMSVWGAWIGLLAFALQIYFDFSGYSDMAIGMGRAMGFHFNENFNHPYMADSVTDFWRRWHMSLGSFFRDYAYIPMGGNRRHQMINLLTVWFLTGMWHGASWNFIFWGLYFGFLLVIEKYAIFPNKHWIPKFIIRIWALMAVLVGWALFYFDDFEKMKQWFSTAFSDRMQLNLLEETALTDNFWIWIIALLACMPLRAKLERYAERRLSGKAGQYVMAGSRAAASAIILILCVALLVGATNNAFIYTRF